MTQEQLERVRRAYDLTVEEHSQGIDPLEKVPLAFRESAEFKAFEKDSGEGLTNSAAPENKELNRVLKASARLVIDIPNVEHPHVETMFKIEEYLGRPNIPKPRVDFEAVLTPLFDIVRADDSRVMLKYFLEAKM